MTRYTPSNGNRLHSRMMYDDELMTQQDNHSLLFLAEETSTLSSPSVESSLYFREGDQRSSSLGDVVATTGTTTTTLSSSSAIEEHADRHGENGCTGRNTNQERLEGDDVVASNSRRTHSHCGVDDVVQHNDGAGIYAVENDAGRAARRLARHPRVPIRPRRPSGITSTARAANQNYGGGRTIRVASIGGGDEGHGTSFRAEEISLGGGPSVASSVRIEQHQPDGADTLSSSSSLRGVSSEAERGRTRIHANCRIGGINEMSTYNNEAGRRGWESDDQEALNNVGIQNFDRAARDVSHTGPAQYPGAVPVRGINATDDDDEGTIVIGDDLSQATPPYVVREAHLARGSPLSEHGDTTNTNQHQTQATRTDQESVANVDSKKKRIKCRLGGFLVLLAATIIVGFLGIVMFNDKKTPTAGAQAYSSPPSAAPTLTRQPTAAPASYEWVLSAEIVGDVDTFGFAVDLNDSGTRLAIAAPKAHDGRGQVEVYEKKVDMSADDGSGKAWTRLGEAIVGDDVGDDMSFGMDLSGNGDCLAVGYPGNGNGFVRVFEYVDGQWIQKGQTVAGSFLDSHFGAAISLNANCTHLVVGAPLAGYLEEGMFQAYEWTGSGWVEYGPAMFGESPGDHSGTSVSMSNSGNRIVVGDPNHDTHYCHHAGAVHIFEYDSSSGPNWRVVLPVPALEAGFGESDRFGQKVVISGDGAAFVAASASFDGSFCHSTIGPASRQQNHADPLGSVVVSYATGAGRASRKKFQGWRQGLGYGYDVDICGESPPNHLPIFSVTTLNNVTHTGFGRVYLPAFETQLGGTMGPLPMGKGAWMGSGPPYLNGPSISMTGKGCAGEATDMVVAVGYQSVVRSDGEDVPGLVAVYRLVET